MAMSPEERNAYVLNRYYERRAQAILDLGGKCAMCGSKENLELDHVNPEEKSFDISTGWSYTKEVFDAELVKCQILCADCHRAKSSIDNGVGHGEGLSGKRNCKCELCKARKAEYMRKYRRTGR